MSKKDNFFNTPWSARGPAERVLVISGTIGAIVGGVILIRRAGAAIQERKKQKAFDVDKETFEDKGQKLSYPVSQYYIFADTLFNAMDSSLFDWGTAETTVAGVMYKMKNDLDVLQTVKAFGKKDGYTLAEWIAGDFDPEDKNFYINNILAKKGIKFRF